MIEILPDSKFYSAWSYGVNNKPELDYGFVYRRYDSSKDLNYIHHCKELGCFYMEEDQLLYKLLPTQDPVKFVENFKKIDGWHGLDTKVEIIPHKVGPLISIPNSWYSTNKISREVGAIILKDCYKTRNNLKDFVNNSYYPSRYEGEIKFKLKILLSNPVAILKAAEKANFDYSEIENRMNSHYYRGLITCISENLLDPLLKLPII